VARFFVRHGDALRLARRVIDVSGVADFAEFRSDFPRVLQGRLSVSAILEPRTTLLPSSQAIDIGKGAKRDWRVVR
jgi:hypothetical protein